MIHSGQMHIDFLIVGQGLAGSLLAWELRQRGCRVVIVDNGNENASQIAAGLINPVTGKRLVKSDGVDSLLPEARHCYRELSHFFQQPFYIEKSMLRIFLGETEAKNSLKRLHDPDYRRYLGDLYPPGSFPSDIETPFGCLQQKQTGYLLTRPLLSSLKTYFIDQACYLPADFDHLEIQFKPVLRWRDLYPERIIFCEGHQAAVNPWFSWLPMQPVKGEILTLEHQTELPDRMINYGNWLIPVGRHRIRIGATFDRSNPDTKATEPGKNELLNSLRRIAPALETTVTEHQANIRPCTPDRRPFIGLHPQHPELGIFNGFGAKGSLSIPGYSQRFADFLLKNTPLPQQSDIQRYYATHFAG